MAVSTTALILKVAGFHWAGHFHMRADHEGFDFRLESEEVERIEGLAAP